MDVLRLIFSFTDGMKAGLSDGGIGSSALC